MRILLKAKNGAHKENAVSYVPSIVALSDGTFKGNS